jgi:ribonuclease D
VTSLITTDQALGALAERLRQEARLAFDTEAASFHKYVDRVYLIQVSSARETAIVDPLAVRDLGPMGELLADPAIEVIFHDADYDLRSLDRDYGFRARNIFDSRIAAQLLGEPGVGLGALLLKYFGVTLNKKLQRADWSTRPLTPDMIEYAGADTAHLPALRDLLETELRTRDRLSWAREEFARLELVRWNGAEASPDDHMRLKGARTLAPRAQQVLRALYGWRDQRAKSADRATFRVMQNETLVALAQVSPRDLPAMKAVPGAPPSIVERYGNELLEVIGRAMSAPPEAGQLRERTRRPPVDLQADARFERLKLMRNERAKELGLEPGVLGPNAALQSLAARNSVTSGNGNSDGPELRRWQREALGEGRIEAALTEPKKES